MGSFPASFEIDLHAWIVRVYERRSRLVRRSLEQRILRLLDAERRWLVPLMVGVLAGVAAMPVLGAGGILAALAVLYVGAFVSGVATMRRAERVEAEVGSATDPRAAASWAWENRPALGVDERNQLTRIMNLARSAAHPGVRPVLLDEVGYALSREPLGSWAFMRDLGDLLRADASALA